MLTALRDGPLMWSAKNFKSLKLTVSEAYTLKFADLKKCSCVAITIFSGASKPNRKVSPLGGPFGLAGFEIFKLEIQIP